MNLFKSRVEAEAPEEPSLTPGPPRFRILRQTKDDLKGLYKMPAELWNDNYVGEMLSESDDCHPENSSFIIGATGGLVTGLMTGFFSPSRIPTPISTPFSPNFLPVFHKITKNSVIVSSTAWRIAKRTVLGTVLFAVLECDFKDFVMKKEDKYLGSIVAGAISGGIFGLRGGFRGATLGAILFSSLPAALELYNQRTTFGVK